MADGKIPGSKELMQMDLYGLLGITAEAGEKEIKKAYRQKALTCHPDKNPDNPQAAELFHQLSQALEVLTNGAAKAAYDRLRKAKEAAARRTQQLDDKKKKVKLDLEAREREAEVRAAEEVNVARTLEQEIRRLREEGSRQLEEQKRLIEEQIRMERQQKMQGNWGENADGEKGPAKVKLKWKCKKEDETRGGYSEDVLMSLLLKYGQVLNIVVSSNSKGSAIAEFATFKAAELAVRNEAGLLNNPLKISLLNAPPSYAAPENPSKTSSKSSTSSSQNSLRSERDFESLVLMKMRQAAERQRLIDQLQREDDEAGT
ncbi:dnaJ homolog subfamily C member 17 [Mantella aurantiaca]